MARAFIDCTSSFRTGSGSVFPCELPYLHAGDHRCTLKGEESRIVFYGNGFCVPAETAVTWKPAHDDYRYFEKEAEWLAATSDEEERS